MSPRLGPSSSYQPVDPSPDVGRAPFPSVPGSGEATSPAAAPLAQGCHGRGAGRRAGLLPPPSGRSLFLSWVGTILLTCGKLTSLNPLAVPLTELNGNPYSIASCLACIELTDYVTKFLTIYHPFYLASEDSLPV